MDYLNKDAFHAIRREKLDNVKLQSYYAERKSSDRNRLGPDFKKVLIDCFTRNWLLTYMPSLFSFASEPLAQSFGSQSFVERNRKAIENKIRLDVKYVNVAIPEDVVFQNEVAVLEIGKQKEIARTAGYVATITVTTRNGRLFDEKFCR